jgi:thioredoxin-related protein
MGNPLSGISSLIPPATVRSYSVQSGGASHQVSAPEQLCGPAKYADKLHLPHGLPGYFDYEQGVACAKEQGKPVLVLFKGHACANCKKMENTVWDNPELLRLISEKYVVTGLYTDDRTTLPESDWVKSSDGSVLKTMGKKNLDIQISKYKTNSIPYHVIIKPDGTEITLGVTFKNDEFMAFIKKGIE